jgi:hypothetical protein
MSLISSNGTARQVLQANGWAHAPATASEAPLLRVAWSPWLGGIAKFVEARISSQNLLSVRIQIVCKELLEE